MNAPATFNPRSIEDYRIEYSDDSLRASKNLMEFGSPRPNEGEDEALRRLHGVRGQAHGWMFLRVFRDPHPELGFGS